MMSKILDSVGPSWVCDRRHSAGSLHHRRCHAHLTGSTRLRGRRRGRNLHPWSLRECGTKCDHPEWKCEIVRSNGDDRAGIQLPHILSNRGIFFNERFEKNHVNSIAQTCVVVRGQQLCHVDRERKKSTDELSNNDDLEYIESKIDVSNTIILSE